MRFDTVDVVCAIIQQNGNILGTRRSGSSFRAGKWEFPGGKVKAEELPEVAIIREINEELGISIRVVKRLPSFVHHYPETSIRLIPFICRWEKGEISLKDHDRHAWISGEKLSEYDWSDADRNLISFILPSTDLLHDFIA